MTNTLTPTEHSNSTTTGTGECILVVDDSDENLQVATYLLQSNGYRVIGANTGAKALAICHRMLPDLILLDVMMPTMDGYECCRLLKSDETRKDIPIIFVSALSDTDNIVQGLELGAVDHVGKPFNGAELLARVSTHLRLRKLQKTVEDSYRALSELESLRDNLVHMIVHDLRTPLSVVQGNLDLVKMFAEGIDGYDQFALPLRDAGAATVDLIDMVSNLLDISRMEGGQMPLNVTTHEVTSLLEQTCKLMNVKAAENDIELDVDSPAVKVACDEELIQRVLVNLTANAIKYSARDSSVRLSTSVRGNLLTIHVDDSGPGIPPEYQAKIFEKFGQLDAFKDRKKYSSGLGLTFCKLAVEAHGGSIGVASDGAHGSRFWFTLPKYSQN